MSPEEEAVELLKNLGILARDNPESSKLPVILTPQLFRAAKAMTICLALEIFHEDGTSELNVQGLVFHLSKIFEQMNTITAINMHREPRR